MTLMNPVFRKPWTKATFICPDCKGEFYIPSSYRGKRKYCDNCRTVRRKKQNRENRRRAYQKIKFEQYVLNQTYIESGNMSDSKLIALKTNQNIIKSPQ